MPPRRRDNALTRAYKRFDNFDVSKVFQRPRPIPAPRTIYVNEPLPDDCYNVSKKGKRTIKKDKVYITNQVVTSKYTIFTFLPKNLLEQFRRVANIFFLAIDILQFFPKFSTISPGLVILPLLVIILLTAGKDGYEDVTRHRSDRAVNHSEVDVLEGGGYSNSNHMGPKEKTFTPGVPKIFRRKKKHSDSDEDEDVDVEDEPANAEIRAAEEKEASTGRPVDAQHAMRVNLPPPTTTANSSTSMPAFPEESDGPENPRIDRVTTMRVPRAPPLTKKSKKNSGAGGENPNPLSETDDENPSEPHWAITLWEDVKVGDFVCLRNNQSVPADLVICATSEPENVAYLETKNLDGETNLKSRNAVPELTHLRSAHAIVGEREGRARFRIDAESPDVNMFKFNAAVVFPGSRDGEGDGEEKVHPIDIQTTMLRGTVLRNTDWVIGIVIYTGLDSKIVMNSGNTPSKRSRVERQMNPMVLINLALLAAMAVVCGVVDAILEQRKYPQGAPWLYDDLKSDDNPHINGVITFLNAFITFQNVIPISLYVSIEFVRTAQAAFIYFDPDLNYVREGQKPEEGTATLARSWNLADDLGQIEYIFSDKTGTLTQNSMEFRQCSIGGVLYHGQGDIHPQELQQKENHASADLAVSRSVSSDDSAATNAVANSDNVFSPPVADPDVKLPRVKLSSGVVTHFVDPQLTADIKNASGQGTEQSRAVDEFFTCLGLCHSVLASVDPEDGAVSYRAQSPDEAALVQAAADAGYIFLGRETSTQIVRLATPHLREPKRYELLNLLDFTSARKRMSVILRELDVEKGRILLLCKGADNVIFERLAPGEGERNKEKTASDLDTFAGEGLRTLCLAHRYVSEEEYQAWNNEYHNAQVQLTDRDEAIEAASSKIEQRLLLLGATAIEDKLQGGVPETIADLKRAGIKVWVATGDKLETAIAIGYSTNLISRQSNLIVVRGSGSKSPYDQLAAAADRFFSSAGILQNERVHPHHDPDAAFGRMESRRDNRLARVNTGLDSLVGEDNGKRAGGFVLVIDGSALGQTFEEEHAKELLLEVSTRCEAVICCRVSPLQKALIVRLIKDGLGVMTLAIGDGANDVSMIQAAHVGVGISGEEGLQAVNASDYAIAQFRFLKRLLLVHGQWTYARNGNMIVNFFYKNIVGIGVLWWFQIYCAWSTTYVFEYTYLLFWNVFWSLAPVIAIGIFDRNIDSGALMAIPELYRYGREGAWFGTWPFLIYMLEGAYQSAAVFFLLLYSYVTTTTRKDGYDVYMYEFSTTMVISAVMVLNAFHGISTSAWTWWVWFAVLVGVFLIWVYTAVYSAIPPSSFAVPVYGNDHYLFRSAYYWFGIVLTFFVAMIPRYIAKAYRVLYRPNDIDILRIVHKRHPDIDLENHPLLGGRWTSDGVLKPYDTVGRSSSFAPGTRDAEDQFPMQQRAPTRPTLPGHTGTRTDMSTGLPYTDRGFGFSQEEGGVAIRRIQTNLSEHHDPTRKHQGSMRRRVSRLIPSPLRRSVHREHSKRPTLPLSQIDSDTT